MQTHSATPSLLQLLDRWRSSAREGHVIADYDVRSSQQARKPFCRAALNGEQLWQKVLCAATYLRLNGVRKGDIVAIQLPTWHEYLVSHLAAYAVGAVSMPVSTIFRERDLSKQLVLSQAKVLIVPAAYGTFDYCGMARRVRADIGSLQLVLAVGNGDAQGHVHWDQALATGADLTHDDLRNEIADGKYACEPGDFMLLNYSSGTTGDPKGIMHSTETVLAAISAAVARLELHQEDVLFISVTLGHAAGYLNGMYLPLYLACKVVYQDIWDPDVALHVLEDEGVTYAPAMPAFLYDLANHPRFTVTNLRNWTKARVSGSAISRPLMALLQTHVPHLRLCPGWGLSEILYASCGSPRDPDVKRNTTEGRLLDGYTVEIRDGSTWTQRPTGIAGEIVIKGPSVMLGYFRQEELTRNAFTPDGWLKTGDLGFLDDEGYLTLTGRSKELIIRGGENIPVVEVELLLRSHPLIGDAALVGVPDERLGERACAAVTRKPGQPLLEFEEMKQFLIDHRLTKQFIPEYLVYVEEMPRTSIGKIKKHELRQHVISQVTKAPST